MIGNHLKKYKKDYLKVRNTEPKRCRIKKNSDWKKRGFPFIKYDQDFDGRFLIDLIVHKLHIMLDYYEHGNYCGQADESRLEIVESLKEACRLGDLILEDNFNIPAFELMEKHYKAGSEKVTDGELKGYYQYYQLGDSKEAEAEFDRLLKETDLLREKTIDEFFSFIRKHYREWWD